MCKVHRLAYKCGHTLNIRLSLCQSSYTNNHAAICRCIPLLTIHATQRCGDCLRMKHERRLQLEIDRTAERMDKLIDRLHDDDLDADERQEAFEDLLSAREKPHGLEDSLESRLAELKAQYPCRRSAAPKKNIHLAGSRSRTGSPLRREVVLDHETSKGVEGGRSDGWFCRLLGW